MKFTFLPQIHIPQMVHVAMVRVALILSRTWCVDADIDLRIEITHKDEIREGKICMTIEVKELIRQIQILNKTFVNPL